MNAATWILIIWLQGPIHSPEGAMVTAIEGFTMNGCAKAAERANSQRNVHAFCIKRE